MISDEIMGACRTRLLCLGFDIESIKGFNTFMDFALRKVENYIKNYCNISKVPDGLYELWVDGACGELLKTLKNANLLQSENYDLSAAVKSITEGDVTVSYAINEGSTTDEQRLTALIEDLIKLDDGCLIKYRKLVW